MVNDIRLKQFEAQILAMSQHPSIRVISAQRQVGILTGNGNHCDYVVSLDIETHLSEETVRRHYETLPLSRAVPGQSDGEITVAVFSERSTSTPSRYVVEITDAPNETSVDVRCN